MEDSAQEYYLQVLRDGVAPKWPRPEEELLIGAQKLSAGYTQHWAYVKESSAISHQPSDLPHAEKLAEDYHSEKPAILIDQPQRGDNQKENFLELILVKDGHVWSKSESSLENLDDNLFDILDFAKKQFNMKVEHFMTTSNVSEEVEKKMDQVEKDEPQPKADRPLDEEVAEDVIIPSSMPDKSGNYFVKRDEPVFNQPLGGNAVKNDGFFSKLTPFLIPVIIIGLIFVGTLLFKDQIFSKFKNVKQQGVSAIFSFSSPTPIPTPTSIPTPTPTPIPSFAKSDIQVRVLNGTTVIGAAKTLAEKLKGDGWAILTTGNNSNQAVAQTVVSGKTGKDDIISAMVADLKGEFEATIGANLKDTDKADLEVVIGKK
ncbi:MAG: LytR C-terminal domain-containing protein [Candidatus Daviesbacteria bacterium]|nr:LytR C-terminal domain-containing protein [Candidatus Daviesbacteria bacterium]